MYADDTLLIADNGTDMLALIEIVDKYCEEFQIKLNIDKTNLMIFNQKRKYKTQRYRLKTHNSELLAQDSLKYLGFIISSKQK